MTDRTGRQPEDHSRRAGIIRPAPWGVKTTRPERTLKGLLGGIRDRYVTPGDGQKTVAGG